MVFLMFTVTRTYKITLLSSLLLMLAGCAAPPPYKAYFGDPRDEMQLSIVKGRTFIRTELLNRYIDTIRFIEVDDIPVTNSDQYRAIQIAPGFHDIKVYFSWDLGIQRGLAPAMVDYSRTRDNISRTLRFNARAGETYSVMANPVFDGSRRNITTLSHVDFWVVNEKGHEVVSRAEGRYRPQ